MKKMKERFQSTQDKSMLYISYTWCRGFKGYQVRIGKIVDVVFNWNLYVTEALALKAAQEFRDSMLPQLSVIEKCYRGNLAYSRNTSGTIGVSKIKDSKTSTMYYTAQWTDSKGTRQKAAFSCDRYGEEKAFELAKEAREKAVGLYPTEALAEIKKLVKEAKSGQARLRKLYPDRIGRWRKGEKL